MSVTAEVDEKLDPVGKMPDHPTRNLPSDLQIARQLSSATRAIEIPMIDHVILDRPECDPTGRS